MPTKTNITDQLFQNLTQMRPFTAQGSELDDRLSLVEEAISKACSKYNGTANRNDVCSVIPDLYERGLTPNHVLNACTILVEQGRVEKLHGIDPDGLVRYRKRV